MLRPKDSGMKGQWSQYFQLIILGGVTILLVEQDVQEALDISDRAYVIQTGKVVLEGTGKELLSSELIQKSFLGL